LPLKYRKHLLKKKIAAHDTKVKEEQRRAAAEASQAEVAAEDAGGEADEE
jgi:hypothetical protein